MMEDNRNIIKMDELRQEGGDTDTERNESHMGDSEPRFLSDTEIQHKLATYKGKLPSIMLNDIYDAVKGRRITEEQLDKILEKVESKFREFSGITLDDVYGKIERLEKMFSKIMQQQIKETEESVEKTEEISEKIAGTESSESSGDSLPEPSLPKPEFAEPTIQQQVVAPQVQPQVQVSQEVRSMEFDNIVRLKEVPKTTKGIMFMLKWIEYLLERVGYEGLEDALNYYVDINWISEEVMFDVMRYARGIRLYHQNSDWRPVGYLNVQDHLMSLLFIEALKTGKFSKDLLMVVEREIYRMKKEVSELHGI